MKRDYPPKVGLREWSGFTLVETLVAMAVLAMLMAIVASIIGNVSQTASLTTGRIENLATARAMLTCLEDDLRQGIFRQDLTRFPSSGDGQSTFAFYTERVGSRPSDSATSARRLSYISYQLAESNGRMLLQRRSRGETWGKTVSDSPAWAELSDPTNPKSEPVTDPAAPNFRTSDLWQDSATGVVGFDFAFIQRNGAMSREFSPDPSDPTIAVKVSLAVLSDQAESIAAETDQLSTLTSLLAANVDRTAARIGSTKATWDALLTDGTLLGRLAQPIVEGFRTYEITVPIRYVPTSVN